MFKILFMKKFTYAFMFLIGTVFLSAKEDVNKPSTNVTVSKQLNFNCAEGTAQTILDINNISTFWTFSVIFNPRQNTLHTIRMSTF